VGDSHSKIQRANVPLKTLSLTVDIGYRGPWFDNYFQAERLKELKAIIERQSTQIKRYEEEVQLLNDPTTPEDKVAEIEAAADEEDRQVREYETF
jgi:hypothetical protein